MNVRASGRAWPEDHRAGPGQEKGYSGTVKGRGWWAELDGKGDNREPVTGRPRRKEGPHGAICSSGWGATFGKPQAKPGAK